MIEQDTRPQRALVLQPRYQANAHSVDYQLEEAIGLTEALGLDTVITEIAAIRDIRPNTYLAGGKVRELSEMIAAEDINVVVLNASLTPIQQRNLETALKAKVIDRQGLILEIFALRAATAEGRLQVELARQTYERSRLVRTWTHLERQRGGRGFLAGPGERQIESDRRMLDDRISRLKSKLEDVRRTRSLQRQKRQRAPERIVALVGYTNAGKSTLFNALTEGEVFAEDMLFATLDTTLRILKLPNGKPCLLSDTVGFISDLPTELVAAFQATLEEVKLADLLIHVRDISDELTEDRREDVLDVLESIGAGPKHDQATIEVWNKSDRLTPARQAELADAAAAMTAAGHPSYLVSAVTGHGLEDLRLGIESELSRSDATLEVTLEPAQHAAKAWLHDHGDVIQESIKSDGSVAVVARVTEADAGKFQSRFPSVATHRV